MIIGEGGEEGTARSGEGEKKVGRLVIRNLFATIAPWPWKVSVTALPTLCPTCIAHSVVAFG